MSDQLKKLKSKLEKQRASDVKKVRVVRRVKKYTPKFVPSGKSLEKRGREQDDMRDYLTVILNEDYSDENPIAKQGVDYYVKSILDFLQQEYPDEEDHYSIALSQWEELDNNEKDSIILLSLVSKTSQDFKKRFIERLIDLDPELRRNFIKRFLEQSLPYKEFFDFWSELPEIKPELQRYYEERDRNGKIAGVDDRITNLRNEIIKVAKDYAEERNIDVKDMTQYYDILFAILNTDSKLETYTRKLKKLNEKIEADPESEELLAKRVKIIEKMEKLGNMKSLHLQIAKDYIELAKAIKVKKPEDMSVIVLASAIVRRCDAKRLEPDVVSEIMKMDRSQLLKKSQKYPIENRESLSDTVLRLYILGLTESRKVKAPRESKRKAIPLVLSKWIAPKMMKEKIRKDILSKNPDIDESKLDTLVDKQFEQQYQDAQFVEPEKKVLVDKLARITNQTVYKYENMSISELQDLFKRLEDGQEYWEEFDRERIIDNLVELTGKGSDFFSDRSTEDLSNELVLLQDKRIEPHSQVKKCISTFKDYTWVKGFVTGVYVLHVDKSGRPIASESQFYNTKEYIEFIIDSKNLVPTKFYSATPDFFKLQCTEFKSKRKQIGDMLKCYVDKNTSVRFIVVYTTRGTVKPYDHSKLIKIGNKAGNWATIQNEAIFQQQVRSETQKELSASAKKAELLNQPISLEAINIARGILGSELIRISPRVDYGASGDFNTPYLNIAINTIVAESKTIYDLFFKVSRVIVYLKLQQAQFFRRNVTYEYYLPEILLKLSEQDMLPEVFDNPIYEKTPYVDRMSKFINNNIQEHVKIMVNALDFSFDTTKRQFINTVHKQRLSLEPIPIELCENKDDVRGTNQNLLIDYYDKENSKNYCFIESNVLKRLNQNDYTNPYTGRLFDKNFIRKNFVKYIEGGHKMMFSRKFLLARFGRLNYLNPYTQRAFTHEFIESVKNRNNEVYFNHVDGRLAMCVNGDELTNESPHNIVYYKDSKDGRVYCFSIERLAKIFMEEENPVNPITNKPFSKKFVSKFNSKYNSKLTEGLLKPEFVDSYKLGSNYLNVGSIPGYPFVSPPREGEIVEIEGRLPESAIIIPTLWKDMVEGLNLDLTKSISEESKQESVSTVNIQSKKSSDSASSDSASNDSASSKRVKSKFTKSNSNDSASNDSASNDSASNDSASNDSASNDSASNDSASNDSASSNSASSDSASSNSASSDSASSNSASSDSASSNSDSKSSSMGFSKKGCYKCEKKECEYKSIVYDPEGAHGLREYCSLKCFENDDAWPRYKKKNRKVAKRVKK
jgi:hypothetical protein